MVGTDSTIPALRWLRLWEAGGFMLHDIIGEIEMHRTRTAFHGKLQSALHRACGTIIRNRECAFGDGTEKLFLIDALTRQMAIQVVRIAVRKQQQRSTFEKRMRHPIDHIGGSWSYPNRTHPRTPLQHAIGGSHDCRG